MCPDINAQIATNKPVLLDLFCGAGGAAMGYFRAGFHVVGVDILPQPRYPFEFYQADALTFSFDNFDAIHASPPCQMYSTATNVWKAQGRTYPDLIGDTRSRLRESTLPYVIENVEKAPLLDPILLCGPMFDLQMYRHRLFESNFYLPQLPHLPHMYPQVKMGRRATDGEFIQAVGHFSGVAKVRTLLNTPWMTGHDITQCVPPVYTQFIGTQLMKVVCGV